MRSTHGSPLLRPWFSPLFPPSLLPHQKVQLAFAAEAAAAEERTRQRDESEKLDHDKRDSSEPGLVAKLGDAEEGAEQ